METKRDIFNAQPKQGFARLTVRSAMHRSSHRRCSVRKDVLRNFLKLTGKHLHQILALSFVDFLRTPVFTEHHWVKASACSLHVSSYNVILTPGNHANFCGQKNRGITLLSQNERRTMYLKHDLSFFLKNRHSFATVITMWIIKKRYQKMKKYSKQYPFFNFQSFSQFSILLKVTNFFFPQL